MSEQLPRAVIEQVALRFPGRFLQGYVRGKLRTDPVYGAAFARLRGSSLPVLDLGCGLGLFEIFVRESGGAMPMIGCDFDEPKVRKARLATSAYSDLAFHTSETEPLATHRGHVVLLDVLHYLPQAAQRVLLEKVAATLAPGGYCVIRDTLRNSGWRFRVTQFTEWLSGLIGWNKASPAHFPSEEELAAPFLAAGCTAEAGSLWGNTPFNSHLFTFRRP